MDREVVNALSAGMEVSIGIHQNGVDKQRWITSSFHVSFFYVSPPSAQQLIVILLLAFTA